MHATHLVWIFTLLQLASATKKNGGPALLRIPSHKVYPEDPEIHWKNDSQAPAPKQSKLQAPVYHLPPVSPPPLAQQRHKFRPFVNVTIDFGPAIEAGGESGTRESRPAANLPKDQGRVYKIPYEESMSDLPFAEVVFSEREYMDTYKHVRTRFGEIYLNPDIKTKMRRFIGHMKERQALKICAEWVASETDKQNKAPKWKSFQIYSIVGRHKSEDIWVCTAWNEPILGERNDQWAAPRRWVKVRSAINASIYNFSHRSKLGNSCCSIQ